MMVVDTLCTPSIDGIHASISNKSGSAKLNGITYQSMKVCFNYSYSITGDPASTSAVLEFIPQSRNLHPNLIPARLMVNITECPLGTKGSDSECTCYEALQDFKIECVSSRVSLQVPPLTWIGEKDKVVMVSNYCQYCKRTKNISVNPMNSAPITELAYCVDPVWKGTAFFWEATSVGFVVKMVSLLRDPSFCYHLWLLVSF